jgi:hypothetical protein
LSTRQAAFQCQELARCTATLVTPRRVGPSTSDDEIGSLGGVNEPQTLRDLVQHALATRGGSGRSLAAAAERAGHKVTHTTVNQLAAGTYRFKPSAETIRAIAWLAGVPEDAAFAAAGVPVPGPPFADELPPGVDNLSPRSRRAAIEILRALVDAEERAADDRAEVVPTEPSRSGRRPSADDLVDQLDDMDHVVEGEAAPLAHQGRPRRT